MSTHDAFRSALWDRNTNSQGLDGQDSAPRLSEEEASAWAGLLASALPTQRIESLGLPREAQASLEVNTTTNADDEHQSSRRERESNHLPGSQNLNESQLADTASVNDTQTDRLIVHVDSETLGRVQLIVDRSEGGIKVLVGSDASAKERLSSGKHLLGQALSAAGVRVQSLRFAAQSEVGTLLAQDRLNERAHRQGDAPMGITVNSTPASEETTNRNLNLVG